jgi:fibro-slime domain-containing protein
MLKTGRQILLIFALGAAVGSGCAKVQAPASPGGGPDASVDTSRPLVDGVVISDAIFSTCGNRLQDPTEGCDDGNTVGGDGCTPLCQVEADWICPTWGQACMNSARCGDQKLASNETCDDGNTTPGDGCTADCQVETGWQCRVPGKSCVPLCGDSMIIQDETCDDGNAIGGDGCSSTCLLEPGATCPTLGQRCTLAVCGNGVVEAGESCDAGPLNGLFYGNAMGCSKSCTQEPKCRDGATTRACDGKCGNGNVETGEACDDGNQKNGDGCSATCELEMGFTCEPMVRPDTEDCLPPATGQCLRLPVTYRDFKSEKEVGGHPDFFYLGAPVSPAVSIPGVLGQPNPMSFSKRYCVSNSGGPAKQNDSTARCWDIAQPTLDANGKPAFRATRANGALCDCQFTDWSHDTNGLHVPGYTIANSPQVGLTYVGGANGHPLYRGLAPIVRDAASFGQWFVDGATNVRTVGTLQMPFLVGTQYQFSSDPHSVRGGFFPIDPPGTTPPPGTVRGVPMSNEPLLCNLWPYWYSSTMFGAGATPNCTGDQYLFPPSVDPLAPECANTPLGMIPCRTGMWAPQIQGTFHNFWFTTEVRYLFAFGGPFELQFYGDDDLFIFINGLLVLDLGGVHQRLPGRVQVDAAGVASIIEGGTLNPATNIINPCPGIDPYTLQTTNATCVGGTCDCRTRTLPLGLTVGNTYEIAVFHADRHPTESNYQLTLSGFATNRSNCQAHCGDGVRTGAEECDDGANNNDATYGGCTTQCKFGPYCGDGMVNGIEICDLGRANGAPYGSRDGCTTGCAIPHFCGDANVDTASGEQCDQGETINGTLDAFCDSKCVIKIQ